MVAIILKFNGQLQRYLRIELQWMAVAAWKLEVPSNPLLLLANGFAKRPPCKTLQNNSLCLQNRFPIRFRNSKILSLLSQASHMYRNPHDHTRCSNMYSQMYPIAICHICNTGNPSLGNLSPPDAHLSSFPQAWCIVNPSLLDCFRNNLKTKFWSHIDMFLYFVDFISCYNPETEKYSKARTICVTECISGSVWSICQSQINLSPHQAM